MNSVPFQATEQVLALFHGTPYRLIRPLGEGGMGAVFLVEHVELGRECVAKVLHARFAGDANLIDRMRIEAQSLGRLHHPNIVQITGFGTTHDRRPFLMMEWLQGRTLSDELERRGQIPAREAIDLAVQLLSALSAAHAIGLVHRDIKPENLFLCEEPNGHLTLKVLDFGIARVLPNAPEGAPDPLAIPTATGMVVGTPRYVSPEGAMGQRVDARADLYAAALVLYSMLAGRGPFDELHGDALLAAHAFREPEPPSRYAQTPIPGALDAAVHRALAKKPEDRFQNALEFKAELDRISDEASRSPSFEVASLHGKDMRANLSTDSFTPKLVELPDTAVFTSPQAFSAPPPSTAPTCASRIDSRHPSQSASMSAPSRPATAPPSVARVIAISALTALIVALIVALAAIAVLRGIQ